MADPVSMGLMAGGALVKGIGSIFAGRAQKAANKKAGTILTEAAMAEEPRAYDLERRLNPFISAAYSDQMGSLLGTADTAAGGIGSATQAGLGYLDPYMQAGGRSLSTLSDLVNAPEERFTGQGLEMDPGYAFRMAEGQKAIERSAAARGIGQTGGTLKALTRYGQDAASQEYKNAFERSLEGFKANQLARQDRMRTLSGLAETGRSAAQFGAELGQRGASLGGDLRTRAAQTAGGWGIDSAGRQVDMSLGAENTARGLRLGGAQATANSILGTGQASADMWSGGLGALGGGLQTAGYMTNNPWGGSGMGGSSPQSGGYTYDWATGTYKKS